MLLPTIANDVPSVIYTSGTGIDSYQGSGDALTWLTNVPNTALSAAVYSTGVTALNNTTAPFKVDDLFSAVEEYGGLVKANGRIVSVGLSATYAGTVMDMGGIMTILSRASHGTVLTPIAGATPANSFGAIVPSNIQQFREARVGPVHPHKYTLVDAARLDGEEDYSGNASNQQTTDAAPTSGLDQQAVIYPFSQSQVTSGNWNNYWCTIGAPANILLVQGGKAGSTYICELIYHLEYNGQAAQYNLSPVHSDPAGFALVREASSALPALQAASPDSSPAALMINTIKEAASHVAPAALRAGGAMLQSALAGGSRSAVLTAGLYGLSMG